MSKQVAVVVLLSIATPATPAAAVTQSRWEIGASVGGGPSVVTESWGGVPGHELMITTLYAAHPVIRWKGFSASWVGEILPVVVATKVPKGFEFPFDEGPDFGVGWTPAGVRFALRLHKSVAAFAQANAGAVVFARAMPDIYARSVNLLGSFGGGLRFGPRSQRVFILGYRFTHISNANTAANPGFNAHVFYAGMTLH